MSIRAYYKVDAEEEFLKRARAIMHFKPQLFVSGGAFLFVYSDGAGFCVESGPIGTERTPPAFNVYPTLGAAMKDPAFRYYQSEGYKKGAVARAVAGAAAGEAVVARPDDVIAPEIMEDDPVMTALIESHIRQEAASVTPSKYTAQSEPRRGGQHATDFSPMVIPPDDPDLYDDEAWKRQYGHIMH